MKNTKVTNNDFVKGPIPIIYSSYFCQYFFCLIHFTCTFGRILVLCILGKTMCIWTLSHDLVSLHLGHLRFWPRTVLWVYDDNDTIPCVMSINIIIDIFLKNLWLFLYPHLTRHVKEG
jgi:hypothetical protein